MPGAAAGMTRATCRRRTAAVNHPAVSDYLIAASGQGHIALATVCVQGVLRR